MDEQQSAEQPEVHPLVRELLSHGAGNVVSIGGYVGPSDPGILRLYADLSLRTSIEIPLSAVVRIEPSKDDKNGPSVVLFRTDAEIAYIRAETMRVDQVLAAVAAAPPATTSSDGHGHGCRGGCGSGSGCACGGHGEARAGAASRQSGGGGPIVDLCSWACVERLRLCQARSGTLGQLWCYLNYGACRLGCIDPPIITV